MSFIFDSFSSNKDDGVKAAVFVCDSADEQTPALYVETWVTKSGSIRGQTCGFVSDFAINKDRMVKEYDIREDSEIILVQTDTFVKLSIFFSAWTVDKSSIFNEDFLDWLIWRTWCPAGLHWTGHWGLALNDNVFRLDEMYFYDRFGGYGKYGGLLI